MTYTRERENFIARMARENALAGARTAHVDTYKILRYASTLQRLAVAQCNGDYPADNGERKVVPCPECGSGFVRSSFRKGVCPDCRTSQLVRDALAGTAFKPVFGGDPRGAVLRLAPIGATAADIDSGRERGIYVPARER